MKISWLKICLYWFNLSNTRSETLPGCVKNKSDEWKLTGKMYAVEVFILNTHIFSIHLSVAFVHRKVSSFISGVAYGLLKFFLLLILLTYVFLFHSFSSESRFCTLQIGVMNSYVQFVFLSFSARQNILEI